MKKRIFATVKMFYQGDRYGFALDEKGRKILIHRNAGPPRCAEPRVGQRLSVEVEAGRNGHLRARVWVPYEEIWPAETRETYELRVLILPVGTSSPIARATIWHGHSLDQMQAELENDLNHWFCVAKGYAAELRLYVVDEDGRRVEAPVELSQILNQIASGAE